MLSYIINNIPFWLVVHSIRANVSDKGARSP